MSYLTISHNFIVRSRYESNSNHTNYTCLFNNFTPQGLESYLLILYRRLDIPHSYDLFERTYYAKKIIKFLHNVSIYFPFVKPFTYFLESYMRLLRGRKSSSQTCMAKAEKYAIAQGNKMVIAWIEQNKRVTNVYIYISINNFINSLSIYLSIGWFDRQTWEVDFFNNMAEYWVEFVASSEGILWQEIHLLKPIAWSTILYPYPHPKYNYWSIDFLILLPIIAGKRKRINGERNRHGEL